MSNIRLIKTNFKSSSFLSSVKNKKNISERKNKKNQGKFIKGELRGKLFKLMNNSILLSDEKIMRIREEINDDKYEKYLQEKLKEKNKTKQQPFTCWAKQINIITPPKATMRFEDEYISPTDLFEKQLNEKERQTILSAPYHYGLNYEMLKELHIFSPKNLTQVLDKEENHEQLYTMPSQKNVRNVSNKCLNNNYYKNIRKTNKMAKTAFNKSFPRIKTFIKKKPKTEKFNYELFKIFPLNTTTNDNSNYYNTFCNLNLNKTLLNLNNKKIKQIICFLKILKI